MRLTDTKEENISKLKGNTIENTQTKTQREKG